MKDKKPLSPEELKERAFRLYNRYGKELDQIRDLLEIKLKQLCLAYTIQNNLPPEALVVKARTKTLESFIKKLESKGWPQFYYPSDIATIAYDLIGARITSWFLDDCSAILDYIKESSHFDIVDESIKDYMENPKPSGYRGLHVLTHITYDSVESNDGKISVVPMKMVCEIQIRTKLQDAWGDITHEFHYKAKDPTTKDDLEDFLSDISTRLFNEDKTLIKFRKAYQKLADEKQKMGTREGFKGDSD